MAITLAATGHATIQLPADLRLEGEYTEISVSQETFIGIDGSINFIQSKQTGGLPLTLFGDGIYVNLSTIKAIQAMADSDELDITLTMDNGRSYIVRFSYPVPYVTRRLYLDLVEPHTDDDPYFLDQLNFIRKV